MSLTDINSAVETIKSSIVWKKQPTYTYLSSRQLEKFIMISTGISKISLRKIMNISDMMKFFDNNREYILSYNNEGSIRKKICSSCGELKIERENFRRVGNKTHNLCSVCFDKQYKKRYINKTSRIILEAISFIENESSLDKNAKNLIVEELSNKYL